MFQDADVDANWPCEAVGLAYRWITKEQVGEKPLGSLLSGRYGFDEVVRW